MNRPENSAEPDNAEPDNAAFANAEASNGNAELVNAESDNTETCNAAPNNTETKDADSGNAEPVNAVASNVESGNAEPVNAELGNAEASNVESGNAEPVNAELGNAEASNVESGNAEPMNTELDNAEASNVESGNAEPVNAVSGYTDPGNTAVTPSNTELCTIDVEPSCPPPPRRRGRPRGSRNMRNRPPADPPVPRRRSTRNAQRAALQANAVENSPIVVAGRRERRRRIRSSVPAHQLDAVQALLTINTFFMDSSPVVENSSQQANQQENGDGSEGQPSNDVDMGDDDDYLNRGELPDLFRNVRFLAEIRGEHPWETLSRLVRCRNAVDEADNELALVGPPLAAPPLATGDDDGAGGPPFHDYFTLINNWNGLLEQSDSNEVDD